MAFTQYRIPAGWDYYWITFETTPARDRTNLPIFRESMRRFRLLPAGRKATPDIDIVRARWAAKANAACAALLNAVGPLETPQTLEEAQAFVSKLLRLYEGYELGLYRITPLPPDTPVPFPEATQVMY